MPADKTTQTKRHQRLTRTRGGLLSKHSLWLGDGELLWLDYSAMHERYRRFFLEDIHALIAYPSRRRSRLRWALPLAVGLPPSLLIAWLASSPLWGLAWWILPIALLVWNELAGPSVNVTLVTAVQRTDLTPLKRRREFDRLLAGLRAAGALREPSVAPTEAVPPPAADAAGETPAPAP